MIEYLTFIDELKLIEEDLREGKDPFSIMAEGRIKALKRKYEKRVSDFESDIAYKSDSNQTA